MRVALTGAATGIGAEVAAKLTAAGHEVVGFDITDPGPNVSQWVPVDLSDAASVTNAIAAVDGPFDALINNAGLPPKEGKAELVLKVNWLGLTAFLDGFLDMLTPGAAIVNTASRAGSAWRENLEEVKALFTVSPGGLQKFIESRNIDATRAYNLSKEAVVVMTMTRAEEMIKRGLRMNSVSPAAVSTGILDDFVKAFGEKVAKNIARAGRAGTPGEIANVICFLASPESHWIKGQDIVIDGGMSAMSMADMLGLSDDSFT